MAGKQDKAPDPAPETITVKLGNQHRTSAGDYAAPGIVELPAAEARELLRQGLAVRWS